MSLAATCVCGYAPYYCNGNEHCTKIIKSFDSYFYNKKANYLKMKELFEKLKMNKGKIVSSASCTNLEIAEARACNRMFVDDEGCGFIYFPEIPEVSNIIESN